MFKFSFRAFAIFLGLILGKYAYAAQWAVISVDKAVIYSDMKMESSIGYLKRGKKIRVGEIPKNRGRLLPVLLGKRVGYVRIKDIELASGKKNMSHLVKRYRDKREEITYKRRYGLGVSMAYSLGQNEFNGLNEDGSKFFYGAAIRAYQKNLKTDLDIKIGLDYRTYSEEDKGFTTYTQMTSFYITKNFYSTMYDDYYIDIYLGPVLAPYVETGVDDLIKLTGQALGADVTADIRMPYSSKVDFHLEATYELLRYLNFDVPDDIAAEDENVNNFVHTFKFTALAIFKF